MDLVRTLVMRFTFDSAHDRSPVWSPGGSRIVFTSSRDGLGDLYIKASNLATSEEALLTSDEEKTPNDWSHDGQFLLFNVMDPKSAADVWVLSMDGKDRAMPFLNELYGEGQVQFSADGMKVLRRIIRQEECELVLQKRSRLVVLG
jgi:Tol biopolymer transport system component